jgi:UDP-N-acetylglucosamine 1-carboxyvinyltransferase
MSSFRVQGGTSLVGEITPQGAKNEALQVISAVLLTPEPVTLHKVPNIRDVVRLIELLQSLGVKVEKIAEESYRFTAAEIDLQYLDTAEFKSKAASLRGSIMMLGPLLTRFGTGKMPKPGGDKIGRRRVDTHFFGFEKLGAEFHYDAQSSFYTVEGKHLKGSYIHLEEASVTGTANIVMAAVMAEGETTLYNAACEPYVQQLCGMLVNMGAKIEGIGSNLLRIEGVSALKGTEHQLLPDMIEIGSFIGMAALTQSDITIKNAGIHQLGIIPSTFEKLGIQLEISGDDIRIPAQDHYEVETYIDGSILTIADAIWPGLTPDLLSVILVTATQAKGTVLIHQKMFESRLFFVDKLIDMGAQIILCDPHRATVIGLDRQQKLKGISMTSPDIRAGVSLLLAAMSAEGESVIHNVEQIDRGYQHIDERLNALGAQIERLS